MFSVLPAPEVPSPVQHIQPDDPPLESSRVVMCDLFSPRDVDFGPGRANVVLHVALERVADAAVRAEGGDGEETSSRRMPRDTVLHRVDVKDSLHSHHLFIINTVYD